MLSIFRRLGELSSAEVVEILPPDSVGVGRRFWGSDSKNSRTGRGIVSLRTSVWLQFTNYPGNFMIRTIETNLVGRGDGLRTPRGWLGSRHAE